MHPSDPLKRFYKTVSVEKNGSHYTVLLDQRQLKSPAKRDMHIPTQSLTNALAEEWDRQEKHIKPLTMPMMALASTAVDRINVMRDAVIEQIVKYAETDLICYRMDDPEELSTRQKNAWDPYLQWMNDTYNAPFNTQIGIMHIEQPKSSIQKVHDKIITFNDWELSALSSVTHTTGSIFIALALMDGFINSQKAFEDSQIDETYQIEVWGEDWEAIDRREALQSDLNAVCRWLDYLKV